MGRFLRRRSGFSLIELLIVVAIIAALVGVAVPFFQDNLSEAQRTKAKQDLEIIKKSIALYDAREPRPLTGTDLKPLLGRYMQEQPKDPWGNEYLFDGAIGFVCSYGADALPLGSGGDTDITVYTKPPLMLTRTQYQGAWGKVRAVGLKPNGELDHSSGNKFIITLAKPATETTANLTPSEFVLLTNLQTQSAALGYTGGSPKQLNLATANDWPAGTWVSSGTTATGANRDPIHNPTLGVFVIQANFSNENNQRQSVTPTMALDFYCDTPTSNVKAGGAGASVKETHYANVSPTSPMDPTVYGADAYGTYNRDPQCVELVNGERRGVRLEKY